MLSACRKKSIITGITGEDFPGSRSCLLDGDNELRHHREDLGPALALLLDSLCACACANTLTQRLNDLMRLLQEIIHTLHSEEAIWLLLFAQPELHRNNNITLLGSGAGMWPVEENRKIVVVVQLLYINLSTVVTRRPFLVSHRNPISQGEDLPRNPVLRARVHNLA